MTSREPTEPEGSVFAFTISCRAEIGRDASAWSLWRDMPHPPAAARAHYVPDPERPWHTWHRPDDRDHRGRTPQQRRVEQAAYMFAGALDLDEQKCRFTYRKVTLTGVLRLPGERYQSSRPNMAQATGLLINTLRWALYDVYGQRAPGSGGFQALATPDVSLRLRDITDRA